MPNRDHHPFTIHITNCRGLPGMFAWNVNRRGQRLRHSTVPYPGVEAARVAAKEALALAVAEWKREQVLVMDGPVGPAKAD